MKERFKELDANGDGKITAEEFRDAIAKEFGAPAPERRERRPELENSSSAEPGCASPTIQACPGSLNSKPGFFLRSRASLFSSDESSGAPDYAEGLSARSSREVVRC